MKVLQVITFKLIYTTTITLKIEFNNDLSMFDVVLIPAADERESYEGFYSCIPNPGLEFLNKYLNSNGIKSKVIYPKPRENNRASYNVKGLKPSVIGLSGTRRHLSNIIDLSSLLKQEFPNTKIIVGGYASYSNEELLSHDCINAVCFSEGEQTILEYIKRVMNNLPTKGIQGLYQRGEKYIPRTEYLDLNNTYLPSFKDIDLEEGGVLSTTRGCNGNCSFCDSKGFNPALRIMNADTVIKWVELIRKHQPIKGFEFHDDNFLVERSRARKIFDYFKQNGLGIGFQSRADSIIKCEDILKEYSSIIGTVGVGIESFSQSQLDRWCKGITVEQNIKALKLLHDEGIYNNSFMILSDRETTIEELNENLCNIIADAPNPVYKGIELPFTLVNFDFNTIISNKGDILIRDIPHLWEPHKFLFKTRKYLSALLQTVTRGCLCGEKESVLTLVDSYKHIANVRLGFYFEAVKSFKENNKKGLKRFIKDEKELTKRLENNIKMIRKVGPQAKRFIDNGMKKAELIWGTQ